METVLSCSYCIIDSEIRHSIHLKKMIIYLLTHLSSGQGSWLLRKLIQRTEGGDNSRGCVSFATKRESCSGWKTFLFSYKLFVEKCLHQHVIWGRGAVSRGQVLVLRVRKEMCLCSSVMGGRVWDHLRFSGCIFNSKGRNVLCGCNMPHCLTSSGCKQNKQSKREKGREASYPVTAKGAFRVISEGCLRKSLPKCSPPTAVVRSCAKSKTHPLASNFTSRFSSRYCTSNAPS